MNSLWDEWDIRKNSTQLHRAARENNEQKVEELLKGGAEPNAKDLEGATPLHEAALHGYVEVIKLLINSGADVNAHTNNGWTPLHSAVYCGSQEVVVLLLEEGADVNDDRAEGDDGVGHTALYLIISSSDHTVDAGYSQVARLLENHNGVSR